MLTIEPGITIHNWELTFHASGPGGQHVNKTASAVELRFDIQRSSLPARVKTRLLERRDRRISSEGVIVIQAQGSRSQHANREEALQRLRLIILEALKVRKPRRPTKPTRSAQRKRLERKVKQGRQKQLRRSVEVE